MFITKGKSLETDKEFDTYYTSHRKEDQVIEKITYARVRRGNIPSQTKPAKAYLSPCMAKMPQFTIKPRYDG